MNCTRIQDFTIKDADTEHIHTMSRTLDFLLQGDEDNHYLPGECVTFSKIAIAKLSSHINITYSSPYKVSRLLSLKQYKSTVTLPFSVFGPRTRHF